jgi:hypothetical protein
MWKSTSTGLSVYFATINRNKRSLSLNLKHEKGRNILFELAKRADVVYASDTSVKHSVNLTGPIASITSSQEKWMNLE